MLFFQSSVLPLSDMDIKFTEALRMPDPDLQ